MNDSRRFLAAKIAVIAAGVAGSVVLTGCSGTSTVSGRLDDARWLPSRAAVTTIATHQVPVYSQRCATKTRTKTTGTGKLKKTSTESYQDCKKVRTGSRSETYTKVLKPAKHSMYCIELDDVNGKRNKDDQWYEVDSATYHKWSGRDEGTKVIKMPYQRSLVSCH